MTRRALVSALSLCLLLSALFPISAAAETIPLPDTMVAVGDSISQAASSAGSLGVDAPQNAWSTGTNSTVNSHYLRLLAAGAPITGRNYNRSVSGAKVADLSAQMVNAAALDPDYVTVLIGGNDLCTDTVGEMTSVADFRARFTTAMNTITTQAPNASVYVVSIPNVHQLWELFWDNWWARFIWSVGGICQSLLASPTSFDQAALQRRETVRQRNIAFNTVLAEVCGSFDRCLFDNNAAFNTPFTTNDVSDDYFHPSVGGQAKLASVSWSAGYTFGGPSNQAPTANFSFDCTNLECAFTDFSSDDGGIVSRSWTFGDGGTSSATNPTHAFAGAGTYTVTLVVQDGGGLTDTASQQVTVNTTAENQPPTAGFTFSCTDLTCSFTDGSTDDGSIVSRTWSFGDGGTSTATNPSHTFATAGAYTVTLTVSDGDVSDTESKTVTVSAAPVPEMALASFTATGSSTGKNSWRATATTVVTGPDGRGVEGATVSVSWGSGSGSCTTAGGTCSVTTENLNKRKMAQVAFVLTGIAHPTLVYDLPDPAPTATATRPQ